MGQISFVSFVRPHLCLLVPTVRIILNSQSRATFQCLQVGRVWCSLACGWTNASVVSDLIQSPGCWAVRASCGAKCTGKWKWTGSGGKQRRKKTQRDTGLEAEACLAAGVLVGLQASLMGIFLLDIERRMRSWKKNGLGKMEYGQNSAWWGRQESQWWEGDFSTSPLRRGLDSAAVLSWGVYMHQPGALPDPVLLPPADWSCSGSWWWEGNLYQCQNSRVHLWILICLHWENFPFPVA